MKKEKFIALLLLTLSVVASAVIIAVALNQATKIKEQQQNVATKLFADDPFSLVVDGLVTDSFSTTIQCFGNCSVTGGCRYKGREIFTLNVNGNDFICVAGCGMQRIYCCPPGSCGDVIIDSTSLASFFNP